MGRVVGGIAANRLSAFLQPEFSKAQFVINSSQGGGAGGQVFVQQQPGAVHGPVVVEFDGLLQVLHGFDRSVDALQADGVVQPGRGVVGIESFGGVQIFLRAPVILDFVKRLAQIAVVERDHRLQQGRLAHLGHRRVGLVAPEQHQSQADMRQAQRGILGDGRLKGIAGLVDPETGQLQEPPDRVDHGVVRRRPSRPFRDLDGVAQPARAEQQAAFLNQRPDVVRIEFDRLARAGQGAIQIELGLLDQAQTEPGRG